MPVLALGIYTAHVSGGEGEVLVSRPVAFTYLPTNRVLFLCLIAYFFLKLWNAPRDVRWSPATKYAALIPGAISVISHFTADEALILFSIPLQTVTLALFVWYAWRAESAWRAAWMTVLASVAVSAVNMMLIGPPGMVVPAVMVGAFNAIPLVVLRAVIREGVT